MLTTALMLALAANEPLPGLAVMDFAVEGVAPEVGSAVSGLVAHELERLQLFRVNSAETTRVILGVDRQRQLLGCDNCSAANLGELTSFEYVVTGKLLRTGGAKDATYNLLLSLLKVGQATPVSSARVQSKGEEKLLLDVPPTTIKLVGKLLEGRQGSLVVSSSETGASIKIDDSQVGTTPLQARVPIAAGPHLLTVEKEGFTQVRKEVRVSADQVSDEFVRLVPSPDMAEQYEGRATRTRILAIGSAVIAAGGVGLFIAGNVAASNIYGSPNTIGSFEWHRTLLRTEEVSTLGTDGCGGKDGNTDLCDHRANAGKLKASIEGWQTASYVGLAAAGVGAIASGVFFIIGDPPGKYEAYRQKTGVVSMQVSPTPGGLLVHGQF